jgi:hypothetical protein
MKTITNRILQVALFVSLTCLLYGCEKSADEKINELKRPVVLMSKSESHWYGSFFKVKGADGTVLTLQDASMDSFAVGDTVAR